MNDTLPTSLKNARCMAALDRALQLLGSQRRFADAVGLRSASVSCWKKIGRVPAERCVAIERITNGQVTRYDLRPDVFGQAPATDLREVG